MSRLDIPITVPSRVLSRTVNRFIIQVVHVLCALGVACCGRPDQVLRVQEERTLVLEEVFGIEGEFCGAGFAGRQVCWCEDRERITCGIGAHIQEIPIPADIVDLASIWPWRNDSIGVLTASPPGLAFFGSSGIWGSVQRFSTRPGKYFGPSMGPVSTHGHALFTSRARTLNTAERLKALSERSEGWVEEDTLEVLLESEEGFLHLGSWLIPRRYRVFNPVEKAWITETPPLYPRLLVSGGPGLVATMETGSGHLSLSFLDGRTIGWRIRYPSWKPRMEEWERTVQAWVGRWPAEQSADRTRLATMAGPPDLARAVDRIHLDPLGRIWVRRLDHLQANLASWEVWDISGRYWFSLKLESADDLLDASADRILTRRGQDLRISRVRETG